MGKQSALRYEIAPVVLEHGTAPDYLNLMQMQNFSINPNAQKSRMRVGGDINSQAFILGRAKPTVTLGTRDLLTALGGISIKNGLCVTKAEFNTFERDVCNAWTGEGVCVTANGGGLIYPDSLSASVDDQDGAMLNMTFLPFWNRTDESPLVISHIPDTSGIVPLFKSNYFMGPIYAGGNEVVSPLNVNINFGLTVSGNPSSPGPYDDLAAITDSSPTITISGSDISNLSSMFYGIASNVAIYFQKGTPYGSRVPAGDSSHIKITATTSDVVRQSVSGDVPGDVVDQYLLNIVGPLTIALDSTIP
jgi:hypothetical protein